VFTDRPRPRPDAAGVIGGVPSVHHGVELGQGVDLRDGHEVIAAKPADLAFHAGSSKVQPE
jgi:hypothetical protein